MITDNNNNLNHIIKSEPMFYNHYYSNHYIPTTCQQENFMDTSSSSSLCSSSSNASQQQQQMFQEVRPANRGGRKQVKVGTNKRNARERNRVRYINNCFELLREHIPMELIANVSLENNASNRNQKLSKVETLKLATLYIKQLTELLMSSDESDESSEIDSESVDFKNKTEYQPNKNLKTSHHQAESYNFNCNTNTRTANSPPVCSASPSSTSSSSYAYHSSSSASSQYSLSPKYCNYEQQSQVIYPTSSVFCNRDAYFQSINTSHAQINKAGFPFSNCFHTANVTFNFNSFC
jgi:hypothetical protein